MCLNYILIKLQKAEKESQSSLHAAISTDQAQFLLFSGVPFFWVMQRFSHHAFNDPPNLK